MFADARKLIFDVLLFWRVVGVRIVELFAGIEEGTTPKTRSERPGEASPVRGGGRGCHLLLNAEVNGLNGSRCSRCSGSSGGETFPQVNPAVEQFLNSMVLNAGGVDSVAYVVVVPSLFVVTMLAAYV